VNEPVAALLRGVNVGGKKVEMARLRALLTDMGFAEVRTLLQSGNAVFTAAPLPNAKAEQALGQRLEAAIAGEFGLDCRVIVRTPAGLAQAMVDDPLRDVMDNGSRHLVGFLSDPPPQGNVAELTAPDYGADQIRVVGRHLYMWCPNGVSNSPFFKMKLDAALGVAVTARNWNTVTKLAGMLGVDGA
jgi:uncharacterized protein (DUF1697 family)